MFKKYLIISFVLFFIFGCNINPLSPRLDQRLDNTDGKIEDIKNNQDGIMLELGKIRNQSELNARDIRDAQQGLINLKGNENSGVQILQGDGSLMLIFSLSVIGMILTFYYRNKSLKAEKTNEIFAQQVALHNDLDLENKIFLAALNTKVEKNIYHLMVKNQSLVGR